jgi:hypothetical protein
MSSPVEDYRSACAKRETVEKEINQLVPEIRETYPAAEDWDRVRFIINPDKPSDPYEIETAAYEPIEAYRSPALMRLAELVRTWRDSRHEANEARSKMPMNDRHRFPELPMGRAK